MLLEYDANKQTFLGQAKDVLYIDTANPRTMWVNGIGTSNKHAKLTLGKVKVGYIPLKYVVVRLKINNQCIQSLVLKDLQANKEYKPSDFDLDEWYHLLEFNDETLKKKYLEIPNNTDILLSHDCPYGVCDMCYGWKEWGKTPEHIGNKPLQEAILDKSPKVALVGHLHSANHTWEQLGNTMVRQVSLLDESYIPTYPIFYFKWNGHIVQDGV